MFGIYTEIIKDSIKKESIKNRLIAIFFIVIIGCSIMAIIDAVVRPRYEIKSAVKIILFFIVPFLYSRWDKRFKIKSLFIIKGKGLVQVFFLGVLVYVFILGCYFSIGTYFDFSNVTSQLQQNVGIKKENFIFVAIYISFINSLLEEFFFRGFIFTNLKALTSRGIAYSISALVFALYHIAMMTSWFSILLFALLLAGLTVGGVLFNYLNEKQGNIYTSWFVHMFANFAINTVGFMLFGIL